MEPFANYPEPPPPPAGSSSTHKAVAVVAVLLGALGLIGGCFGVFTAVAGGAMIEAQGDLFGAPGMPGAEAHREYAQAAQAVVAKWGIYIGLVQLLNLVASGLLLVSGVQVWRSHARAAALTFVACASNSVVDIVATLVNMVQQRELSAASLGLVAGDGQFGATVNSTVQALGMMGMCMAVVWLLIKLIAYGVMSLVMHRRR